MEFWNAARVAPHVCDAAERRGVADHFVTQMLRQGVLRCSSTYSQARLNMMREALSKLDRQANEHGAAGFMVLVG